jgi:hypothetical protein
MMKVKEVNERHFISWAGAHLDTLVKSNFGAQNALRISIHIAILVINDSGVYEI